MVGTGKGRASLLSNHSDLIFPGVHAWCHKGYKLVGIKVLVPSKQLAGAHYEEHAQRPFFPKLVNFLSSGAVVAMVRSGHAGSEELLCNALLKLMFRSGISPRRCGRARASSSSAGE